MRILIADDHPLVREGFKAALLHGLKAAFLGEAQDAEEALRRIRKEPWDLVLMDVTMPGRSGLDVLQDLKSERPQLPVIIISGHDESELALRALRSGAAGFLTKTISAQELLKAIHTVLNGGKYVSEALAERIAVTLGTAAEHPLVETLSNREREVLCLIASAKAPKEIAQTLGLSVKTVATYRSRLLGKMKLQTTAELMRYAIKHGLVS